ncbi:hypothetical protein KJ885_03420 [Patescibacteria group bacterium]|nr:hypothetical protein [Patescibacteria group bacterium]
MKTAKDEFLKRVKEILFLFKSKKKPLLFIFVPFIAVFSLSAFTLSSNNKTPISWTPKKIQEKVFVGTTKVLNAQFVSNEDLENISLEATPGLENFLTIIPSSFQKIEKNNITDIKLLFTVPANTKMDDYGGTIHIKLTDKSKRTYPQTLKVNLSVEEPTVDHIPEKITLPTEDRIYTDAETGNEFVKDELLVGFKDGVGTEKIKEIVNSINGVLIGGYTGLNLYQIKVSITNIEELNSLIQVLEANIEVEFASHSWLDKIQ